MSRRSLLLLPMIAMLTLACGVGSVIPGGQEVQDAFTQLAPSLATALATAGVPAISTAAAQEGGPTAEPAAGPPELELDEATVTESIESGDAWTLYDLINEPDQGEMLKPGVQRYTVRISPDTVVDLSTGWCAKNETIMEENEGHITGTVTVDGIVIPKDQLFAFASTVPPGESDDYPDGLACYSWDTVATNWPVGQHLVIEAWTIDAPINDGYADYEAGDYSIEYSITVAE